MQSSAIPPKFTIPWANSAGGANVRTIPTASQISIQAGAASLTDGFPPLNFIPVSAGGVPPFGQDMNGILKQTTQWLQWQAAAGPVRYDGTFAQSIGGYPAGALLMSTSGHVVYQNLVDNNAGDPNGGAINWRVASSIWSATTWIASGSANAQTVTLSPVPTSLSQLSGISLRIFSQGTNTSAITLNVNGLGAIPIIAAGGIPLASGSVLTGSPFEIILQGIASFVLMSRTNTFYDSSTGGVVIQGPTATGANIALLGNGVTTPNKYIRALNGILQVVNSAYSTVISSLTDAGDYTTSGRLRALVGSTGTSDANAVPVLSDCGSGTNGSTGSWTTIPSYGLSANNNVIIQWGEIGVPGAPTVNSTYNLPRAFPNTFSSITISYGSNIPPNTGAIGAQPGSLSQFNATNTSPNPAPNGCYFIAIGW